jgi:hypothetical protein
MSAFDNLVSLVSAMDSILSVDEVVVVLGCKVLAFSVCGFYYFCLVGIDIL